MSTDTMIFDFNTDQPPAATCRSAVTRTFRELRARKVSRDAALESATTVFGFHHPEIPANEARQTVGGWIEGN